MTKASFDPSLGFFMPWPVVLVSVLDPVHERTNLITIGAVAPTCARPPVLGIAVAPQRYSYQLLNDTGEYVVNIPGLTQARAVDYCGCASGRDVDKFGATGLSPVPGRKVSCAVAAECPINLECRVVQVTKLGSHDFFFGEIVAVQVSENILGESRQIDPGKLALYTGVRGEYRAMGETIGLYGYGKDLD